MTTRASLPATDVVEQFLDRMVAHDWAGITDCLAPDVVRIGPFGDTYSPRERYVAFLADLMPQLPNYSMKVARVTYGDARAVAELSETMDVDGAPLETPEALVFDLDARGQIARIAVYIQRGD
ncbi:MAG TPA: nuclear transport factor 2 family protein [Acidimicrobiales bacterium]|nr:nuclear transport factor 2 family protein [Acidimicrobiales bacterium]